MHRRLNSLKTSVQPAPKRVYLAIGVLVLVILLFLFTGLSKYVNVFYQLLFHKNIDLKQQDKAVNILLLGTGGGSHEGPNLTDTLMFARIDPENNKVTLISIPRDLWIPDLQAKANTAYAYGEEKEAGGGLLLAKAVVSKVLGQQIDYVLRIDFNGFVKAVDLIGGLDIAVDQSFDDYQYPVEEKREDLCGHTLDEATELIATQSPTVVFPCRYMHLHFDKGEQHMDGKTALMFVRSRYAEGVEGTDFARSKRQEKVITAFKDKILSTETLLSPTKALGLYNVLEGSIDTDIKEEEFDDFIRLFQKVKSATIQSYILDAGDEEQGRAGLLVNPPISEEHKLQWVLTPREGTGDFSEIHSYMKCIISKDTCTITTLE